MKKSRDFHSKMSEESGFGKATAIRLKSDRRFVYFQFSDLKICSKRYICALEGSGT